MFDPAPLSHDRPKIKIRFKFKNRKSSFTQNLHLILTGRKKLLVSSKLEVFEHSVTSP